VRRRPHFALHQGTELESDSAHHQAVPQARRGHGAKGLRNHSQGRMLAKVREVNDNSDDSYYLRLRLAMVFVCLFVFFFDCLTS
jgi:hypothetical protein